METEGLEDFNKDIHAKDTRGDLGDEQDTPDLQNPGSLFSELNPVGSHKAKAENGEVDRAVLMVVQVADILLNHMSGSANKIITVDVLQDLILLQEELELPLSASKIN